MSTAFAFCAATSKPIVYYNLNRMNLATEALGDARDRVTWVDIDDEGDLGEQIAGAVRRHNRRDSGFENRYTPKYSVDMRGHRRLEDVVAKARR